MPKPSRKPRSPRNPAKLTPLEARVLELTREGKSCWDVADAMPEVPHRKIEDIRFKLRKRGLIPPEVSR